MWEGSGVNKMEDLKKILFQRNPYLQPDTFYLGKLEAVFYEGRAQEGTSWRRDGNGNLVEMNTAVVAVSNIAINIRKGIS